MGWNLWPTGCCTHQAPHPLRGDGSCSIVGSIRFHLCNPCSRLLGLPRQEVLSMRPILHSSLAFILVVASSSCATSPSATPRTTVPAAITQPTPTGSRPLPKEIRWFRNSAGYRALARLVYRDASEHLPNLSRGLEPGS